MRFRLGMMAIVATAALVAAAAGIASATTAATTRWRFSYTSRTAMTAFYGITALSAHDAWAVGSYAPEGGPGARPIVERWNGRSWSAVTLPKRYRTNAQLTAIAASSPTNVWVFGFSRDSNGLNPQTFALRWNGSWSARGDWHTSNVVNSATVLNSGNVWIFGTDWTLHYNGTAWTTRKLSFSIAQASAINRNDIWAVGASNSDLSPVLARLHNGRWQLQYIPVTSSNTTRAALLGVLARSDTNIWVVGATSASSGFHPLALHLLNGKWTFHTPSGIQALSSVAPDGAGGLWATTASSQFDGSRLEHYSGGHWHAVVLPTVTGKATSVTTLARAPRSTTVFAAGIVLWGGLPETEATILKYQS